MALVSKVKIVPASRSLRAKWSDLRSALSAAAEPFTGAVEFPIAPFYAYALIGGAEEAEAQLKSVGTDNVTHRYEISAGGLVHDIRWTE